jgi:hypothetical protein
MEKKFLPFKQERRIFVLKFCGSNLCNLLNFIFVPNKNSNWVNRNTDCTDFYKIFTDF